MRNYKISVPKTTKKCNPFVIKTQRTARMPKPVPSRLPNTVTQTSPTKKSTERTSCLRSIPGSAAETCRRHRSHSSPAPLRPLCGPSAAPLRPATRLRARCKSGKSTACRAESPSKWSSWSPWRYPRNRSRSCSSSYYNSCNSSNLSSN